MSATNIDAPSVADIMAGWVRERFEFAPTGWLEAAEVRFKIAGSVNPNTAKLHLLLSAPPRGCTNRSPRTVVAAASDVTVDRLCKACAAYMRAHGAEVLLTHALVGDGRAALAALRAIAEYINCDMSTLTAVQLHETVADLTAAVPPAANAGDVAGWTDLVDLCDEVLATVDDLVALLNDKVAADPLETMVSSYASLCTLTATEIAETLGEPIAALLLATPRAKFFSQLLDKSTSPTRERIHSMLVDAITTRHGSEKFDAALLRAVPLHEYVELLDPTLPPLVAVTERRDEIAAHVCSAPAARLYDTLARKVEWMCAGEPQVLAVTGSPTVVATAAERFPAFDPFPVTVHTISDERMVMVGPPRLIRAAVRRSVGSSGIDMQITTVPGNPADIVDLCVRLGEELSDHSDWVSATALVAA